jgi:hypothetical protein
VLVQDNVQPVGPTSWLQYKSYTKTEEKLPLSLQDHGNPVRYRNVWLRELPPETIPQPSAPYDPVIVQLTKEQMAKIVGKYNRQGGNWEIQEKDGKLWFHTIATPLEMIPHSEKEFGLRYTSGSIVIDYDDTGKPKSLEFSMGGSKNRGLRAD